VTEECPVEGLTVVAMGGHALLSPRLPPTVQNQFLVTAQAMLPIVDMVEKGVPVLLTHGNGPQVGFMHLRSEMAKGTLHTVPLDSLVADTQGSMGYMIQRALREELLARGIEREVACLITEVRVDPESEGFEEPTKPIGRFYSKVEAEILAAERGWKIAEDPHRGWRRLVPSPSPVEIVQLPTIRRLVEAGVIVIACGGGGIPVFRGQDGHIEGVEAVVDKDRASAVLAVGLGVKRMIIMTDVDAVYRDFGKPNQEALLETTVEEIRAMGREGQFPPGSMRPKMDASIYFLNRSGEEAFICRPEQVAEVLDRTAGTRIVPGGPTA
jgi:carbamate kinase